MIVTRICEWHVEHEGRRLRRQEHGGWLELFEGYWKIVTDDRELDKSFIETLASMGLYR